VISCSAPGKSSTPIGISRVEEINNVDEVELDDDNAGDNANVEGNEPPKEVEVENPFQTSKRPRRSKVRCKYWNSPLSLLASKSTSHVGRHQDTCIKKAEQLRQQKMIKFLPSNSSTGGNKSEFVPALHDGKLYMLKMREGISHWITMHEHPVTTVEEEGFNLKMKRGIPQWTSVSRHTIRLNSFKVFEFEKKKLKSLFKKVDRISLTTDLWWSKPQKIEYMVLTAHFVDMYWKLQKTVLNFVFSISVDNVTTNDSCIQILKDNFSSNGRLLCNGNLFHIRCCAHILKVMVQHGLEQVKHITAKVHDTVDYLNSSDARLKHFGELISQYNLKERKLVLECKIRWNSTYDMLDCAIKFRKMMSEKNMKSGVRKIKVVLDNKVESPDEFVRDMVQYMKQRFDKY
ncbi:Zinc finger BED domain-containing protein RICESLEEPER 2, partial [Bienertia sinuspersici]